MKKDNMRRMCCILLVLCLTFVGVGCSGEKAPQSYEYTESETVAVTETENLQVTIENGILEKQNDRDWAVYNLQQAHLNAVSFLGEGYAVTEPIRCCIYAGDGLTQMEEGALDIYFYETVEQPYTNYMIQILAGLDAPDWLREGLAAYGADLAEESLLSSYGSVLIELDSLRNVDEEEKAEYADVSALARLLYEAGSHEEALELGDMLETMSQMETAEEAAQYRGAYCIYAGSFVKYLAESKGLDEVMKVYQGEDFTAAMGKSLTAMHKAWIAETFINE